MIEAMAGAAMDSFEILIVEDNAADLSIIREALREENVRCALHVARDGEQAIEFIRRADAGADATRLDLMILDVHLPRRNGYEVLQSARCSDRTSSTPVIMLSAWDPARAGSGMEQDENVFHFPKPASLAELSHLGAQLRAILERGAGRRRDASANSAAEESR
jgi:CheY-like chemotaxis protein